MKEWIYGRNPVYETLRAGRRTFFRLRVARNLKKTGHLKEILQLGSNRGVKIERIDRGQLDSLESNHQGIALEVSDYPYGDVVQIFELADQRSEAPFILLLDTLKDPQNLGTLLRTAEAVGVHGVILPLRRTATVTPAVVSASSGASEHLLIAQANLAQAIRSLKENDVWVIGLEDSPEASISSQVRLDGPLALVVGSEGRGMRHLVRKSCDLLLKLPMRGKIDSFNAAVAGSIALYLGWQARNFQGFESKSIDV